MTTSMTTTTMEGNRIIAEFMGAQLLTNRANEVWIFSKQPTPYYRNDATYTQFNYDTDWNWLMPVVEKIEAMGFPTLIATSELIGGYYMNIMHNISVINATPSNPSKSMKTDKSKIVAVYNTVLEFINWYNTSNRPEGE